MFFCWLEFIENEKDLSIIGGGLDLNIAAKSVLISVNKEQKKRWRI